MPQQHNVTASQLRVVHFSSIFAGGGVDYNTPNPTTFTFTSAQTVQCTNIPINDDSILEEIETFTIQLSQSSPDPGVSVLPAIATVFIADNDGKSLYIISDLVYAFN